MSAARVAALTAFRVRVPLRRPIRHASHRRTDTENVVVRCTLNDGTTGYGEGVPRDYVTGETAESGLGVLRGSGLADQLTPCESFERAVGLCESLRLAGPPDSRGVSANAARCALELALLDAFGKRFGRPLSDVTTIVAPELHEASSEVRYSGAIMSAKGWKLAVMSWVMRLYGFRQVKVKVGIDGQDDDKRLASVRKRVGRGVELRVDANEAWTPEVLRDKCEMLARHGVVSVEQPVPHERVGELPAHGPYAVPVMFDESLCGVADAERAVSGKLCDLFNLRLSKCGGFIWTLLLAQFAARHGVGCQLGCQVGETAILSAAGRHFATSVRKLRCVEGSFDRHLVREALGTRDITFGGGGLAHALTGPGLGIEIDPARLARVAESEERIVG